MTLVNIDIKNVASETHPDDRVVFYSPTLREAPGGGLTSTAETVVPLVGGVGEIELVPGPLNVTFQCRGIADTRPKSGTIPDAEMVDIRAVINDALVYSPEVVEAAQRAAGEAKAAAGEAAERVIAETKWMHDDAAQYALDAGKSAASAESNAVSAATNLGLTINERNAAADERALAEAAAWRAQMTTVGVNVVESPPGSGIWVIGAETLAITESPATSGLYEIGVINE